MNNRIPKEPAQNSSVSRCGPEASASGSRPTGSNSTPLLDHDNTMAIYTVLRILMRLKDQLGIEAMLEYIKQYLALIDRNNPEIDGAVSYVLSRLSVEKLYGDAMHGTKK